MYSTQSASGYKTESSVCVICIKPDKHVFKLVRSSLHYFLLFHKSLHCKEYVYNASSTFSVEFSCKKTQHITRHHATHIVIC